MATVYLARDLRHESQVAIKVLRPELAAVLGAERFSREIRITASLQHPSILPLLDSGDADGLPFYVMPYVEGESLAQRLHRETRLSLDEAVRLGAEVADGLAYAHSKGFVHRDIKPANILLANGHAVIADFGIARALINTAGNRITDSGMAIGTAPYMSPEQAGSESVDGRSDIYSLGCVLYEMLSGAPPFTGPSAQAIMARNAVDPVPSLRTVRATVPQALEGVINKALAKTPQDRFATAAEFRDALVRAAAMPVTREISRHLTRRRRLAGGLAAAALLTAAAVLFRVGTGSPPLDLNRVMVFPLLLPGDWRGSTTAGEDVATVIGSAMDGAGSLRWVDGWQFLTPSQRDAIRTLGINQARALAREQRCAFVVTGKLVARGDSADVFLELHDVQGDSLSRFPGKAAPIGESWRGAMAGITAILPSLIRTAVPDVESEWRARPPQAVAHFLLGESAFRRARFPVALAEFQKAIEADSTFGLAAVRGAQAATWNHQAGAAATLIRTAVGTRMAPRYQRFARGFRAYLDGQADSAVAELRAALALDSSMIAAWMQLGEAYIHLLPAEGNTDSLAEAAFVRARELDSTAATQQFHLVEILTRKGDAQAATAMAREFIRASADSQLAAEVGLMSSCTGGAMRNVDLRDAARQRPLRLLLASKALGSSPTSVANCAIAGYEALLAIDTSAAPEADSRRFYALLGHFNALLRRGETEQAVRAVEQFRTRWGQGRSLYLLAGPVVPALADSARAVAREDSVRGGADYAGISSRIRRWELGVWAAAEGKPALAQAVARRLLARADSGARVDTLLARSMAAHAALARGDSADALRRFETLLRMGAPTADLQWNEAASAGYDRVVLGRLLLARNEPARAIRVLEVLESATPAVFPLYLKTSLALRADAARALGQPALASAFQARVAALSMR
jgi:tetratricopeptide (TPR) repeat protein